MPLYNYTCPSCSTTSERLVSYDKRDEQKCDFVKRRLPIIYKKVDGEKTYSTCPFVCGTLLIREEIPLTAKMSENWAKWCSKH